MKRDTHYRFTVNAAQDAAELMIFDDIGESWFGGITAKQVAADLKAAGKVKQITCRINSQGGDVFDAFAIYNQLVQHPAKVTCSVEGIALSSASVIAMAGDVIEMAASSWMMIHDPWTFAIGNGAELRAMADKLDQFGTSIANIYADRTGTAVKEVQDMMAAETWMDGAEAKRMGFCNVVNENLKVAAYHLSDEFKRTFRHVPQNLGEREQDDREVELERRSRLAAMSQRVRSLS